ncbi:MAG: nucleotidyltransferase domain-containing protein [Bdellovibrionota bacterium]
MRLLEKEILIIKKIFSDEIKGSYDLKLFGSRTDDMKKGGDIDLLLVVDPIYLKISRIAKYKILDQLYQELGEQKIDIVITTAELLEKDSFLSQIQGIEL